MWNVSVWKKPVFMIVSLFVSHKDRDAMTPSFGVQVGCVCLSSSIRMHICLKWPVIKILGWMDHMTT